MGDKRAATNYPRPSGSGRARQAGSGYNTAGYYESSEELGRSRQRRPRELDDQDLYDDYYDGKEENYKGRGYYGSNYGSITEGNRGRDVARNAGYRENYNDLPTGQWPAIEDAAARRGMDLHWQELQSRGVHRGKGPRGYQRSDERIREDVHDVLLEDRYIDATDVEVEVRNGEVILSGLVDDRNIKRKVEDVIEDQVSGIRHLENRLRTRFAGGRIVNVDVHRREKDDQDQA